METFESKMQRSVAEAERGGTEHTPLMKRLLKPRSVFTPGHRIRMNIIPFFLNIFVPWGIFAFLLACNCFSIHYVSPFKTWCFNGITFVLWLVSVVMAIYMKKNDPEPSWFIYFSVILGFALFGAVLLGEQIYDHNTRPYYTIKDLKVVGDLDASKEHGQNVMDAGLFYFAEGNQIDAMRSWHFKQGTLYCVAPVIKGFYPGVPDTQSFDFWAVGKDCCSETASDFRCGNYNNPLARAGIRILNDADRPFYRLAVEQAQTTYGIMSQHPVFFEWAADPLQIVHSWNTRAFTKYLMAVGFAFVFTIFGVACAAVRFSFIGRAESPYGEDILGDPEYQEGGPPKHIDFHTHVHKIR
jgi:hypothetical protein